MKYKILIVLFIISLVSSIILSLTPVSEMCDPDKGCDVVQHSKYNSTFSIKNSYYGIVIFLFAILLTLSQIKRPTRSKRLLINLGIVIGTIVAIYFLYLQQFVLKAFCKYCTAVDISMIVAFLVVIVSWRRERRRWLYR